MREIVAGVSGPTSAIGVPLALALVALLVAFDLRAEAGRPMHRRWLVGAAAAGLVLVGIIAFRFAKIAA